MIKVFENSSYQKKKNENPQWKPKVSLLISVYNKFDYFELVWASVELQSLSDFEVLVCDDGSKTEQVELFQKTLADSNIPARHLWHADIGVRKVEILNWGVIHSLSDYLTFIDGDCALHPEFLSEHFQNRQPKAVLAGRRMDLTEFVTRQLSVDKIKQGYLPKNMWWILPAISWMKDNNGPKGIYIRSPRLRKCLNRKAREIVGCNFSIHKQDFLDINGYDTRYNQGLGTGEDSDIDFRLRLNGARIVPFCHAAIQYHLYHKTRPKASAGEALFQEVKSLRQARTPSGIAEMLNAPASYESAAKPSAE